MNNVFSDPEKGTMIEDAPNSMRKIAPYIKVTLKGASVSGDMFCELTFVRGTDGAIVKKIVQPSMLRNKNELLNFLANYGFEVPTIPKDETTLCEVIRAMDSVAPRALFAEKLGWINKKWANELDSKYVYITPEKSFGKVPNDLTVRYVENADAYNQNIETSGTLQDWIDNIGVYIKYSPLLTLSVCLGLGTIIMMPCGIENFFIHLWGDTSKGKTITELVCQSLFRLALKNLIATWDITPVGLIDKCSAYSDSAFILDEVTKFSGTTKQLQDMIYGVANGSGRITSYAYAKSVKRVDCNWNIAVLSSGEKAITQVLKEGNTKILNGFWVRCFEVNSIRHPEHFIFTHLPKDMKNSATLAKLLEENTSQFYGTPAQTFLKKFMKLPKKYINFIKKKKQKFFNEIELDNSSVKGRIADRFAFLEAVGLLAIEFGILPLSKNTVKSHIRLLCNEVLEQHKTDDELIKDGLKILSEALQKEYLVRVAKKGKKFSDDEKMAWGYIVTRDVNAIRHFVAIRKSNFDSMFSSKHQSELIASKLMSDGIMTHKQVDFVAFPDKPQFHCLNLEKLKKNKLYK